MLLVFIKELTNHILLPGNRAVADSAFSNEWRCTQGLGSLVPRPFPYLTACARGKEGSGKMLGLSAGPGILSAYRKRNIQVAVKPQCTYIQQLH